MINPMLSIGNTMYNIYKSYIHGKMDKIICNNTYEKYKNEMTTIKISTDGSVLKLDKDTGEFVSIDSLEVNWRVGND